MTLLLCTLIIRVTTPLNFWLPSYLMALTFISKVYGGRSTGSIITYDSGFLSLLDPGDLILSDMSFPCISTSLENRGVTLLISPFAHSNDQFTPDKVDETHKIDSVRIHIERCVQRIKLYRIMSDKVTRDIFPNIDRIVYACAVSTNIQLPINSPAGCNKK